MKQNEDYIQIMLDSKLSKDYIKQMKGESKRKNDYQQKIEKLRSFYKTLSNEDLRSFCVNKYSCLNKAVNAELKDRIKAPLTIFWPMLGNVIYNIGENPNYYQTLLKMKDFPSYFQDTIEKDVVRTTNNIEIQNKLRNVLNAYTIRNGQIGYCQGFNYITFFILQQQQITEEETFWLLCHLFETILPPNYYNHLFGVLCDDQIIKEILVKQKPQLFQHFKELQVETSLFTIQWLVCCYTFHNKLSQTIFDLLLTDGSKAQIKCAIVYLNLMEDLLYQAGDIGTLIMTIENFITTFADRQQFIEEYDKVYINNKLLQYLRQDVSNQVVQLVQDDDDKRVISLNNFLNDLKTQKCDLKYPICIYELETWTRNKKHLDSLTFRIEDLNININQDKTNKNKQPKNQIIVRQNHICKKDDGYLVRELQHKDVSEVQLVNINAQAPSPKQINSTRARSPLKDFLLSPIKMLDKYQHLGQKLKMNPKIYKIEHIPLTQSQIISSINVRMHKSGWKSQRGRSPEQTKLILKKMNIYGQSPKRKHEMNNQVNQSTDVSQQYNPILQQCKSITFIEQLSRYTNLISIGFQQDQPDQQ